MEERITAQRTKITNMRMAGIPADIEKDKLEALLQSLEALKTQLANVDYRKFLRQHDLTRFEQRVR